VFDGLTRSSGTGDGIASSFLAGCAALQHCTSAGAVRLKRRISILFFIVYTLPSFVLLMFVGVFGRCAGNATVWQCK
jgi:hypothetical protein